MKPLKTVAKHAAEADQPSSFALRCLLAAFLVVVLLVHASVSWASPTVPAAQPHAEEAKNYTTAESLLPHKKGPLYRGTCAADAHKVDLNAIPIGAVSADYSTKVQELYQWPFMPAGCEAYSLTCVLNAMGVQMDPVELFDKGYLPISADGDFVNAYFGSPYESGMALPPAIAKAGTSALSAAGSDWHIAETTGASLDKLNASLAAGVPALVWTTDTLTAPLFNGVSFEGFQWYNNEHCVVLLSVNAESVVLMDPLRGMVSYPRADFESIYNLCGRMSAVPVRA